jgi:tRNA threonylcarbamoyladenosine biosynthesis protein TsaB
MKILLIDTCGSIGSVVLADTQLDPAVVAATSLPGRTASERLVLTIKDLAASAGITLQSLGAVVVVYGPGSFTGVRVGLSAAKGLCEALTLPLVAISRLAVLAHLAVPAPGVRIQALLDAGRGEFYSGIYVEGICLGEALVTRDRVLGTDATQSAQPPQVVVTCESVVAESVAELAPKLFAEPSAADALPLALRRLQHRDFDDVATIDANYLRRTDAEIFAKPTRAATRQPETSAR